MRHLCVSASCTCTCWIVLFPEVRFLAQSLWVEAVLRCGQVHLCALLIGSAVAFQLRLNHQFLLSGSVCLSKSLCLVLPYYDPHLFLSLLAGPLFCLVSPSVSALGLDTFVSYPSKCFSSYHPPPLL